MIEYGHRMAAVWFAGQAGNWDLAQYQLAEMVEIQEVGETTRPARAPALKSFESSFLDPLDEAIKAKDKTRSRAPTTQLSRAATPATVFAQEFKFIKVQVPKDTLESIYAYTPW